MSESGLRLYSYWRSSAAFRVRIAINLKGLPHELVPVNLALGDGEQHSPEFLLINPQAQVPVLVDGGRLIRQSLAIIEYLDEMYEGPHLLPTTARERARARGLAQLIACDIHPLNNSRVLKYLDSEDGMPQMERQRWIEHWIELGFVAFENMLVSSPSTGDFCEGDLPTIADCCLVPQVFTAQRWGVDLTPYPTIARITASCLQIPAFDRALPENQPDAPKN
ncbi:MAG: maleylacetoacetate isomerase [Lysobacterales bacterium CG02_land_8_20_14_3_00_62_12]|nr:MAG: maleylacetoacetate isomerase [Xanthomonadales bacterium CG02_land_8_20_14_3_00_62_12]